MRASEFWDAATLLEQEELHAGLVVHCDGTTGDRSLACLAALDIGELVLAARGFEDYARQGTAGLLLSLFSSLLVGDGECAVLWRRLAKLFPASLCEARADMVAQMRESVSGVRELVTEAFGADSLSLLQELSDDDLTLLLVRLHLNTHADGCYPLACLLNHSCAPSASASAADGLLLVRSLTGASAGAPLTISYLSEIELLLPVAERRALLRARYAFDCLCQRCADELGADAAESGEAQRLAWDASFAAADTRALMALAARAAPGSAVHTRLLALLADASFESALAATHTTDPAVAAHREEFLAVHVDACAQLLALAERMLAPASYYVSTLHERLAAALRALRGDACAEAQQHEVRMIEIRRLCGWGL